MLMQIDQIIIRKRLRRDLGDLEQLAESIKKHGLLNPVIVTHDNILLAGERRLEAARLLGWKTIPARVIDRPGRIEEVEIEIDENIHRKPFTADEAGDAIELLDKLRNPGFFRKLLYSMITFFKRIAHLFKRK
jgi:ParB family chromosome partitioning protein